jgi:hypothetical protein
MTAATLYWYASVHWRLHSCDTWKTAACLQLAAGLVRVHKAAAGVSWALSQHTNQPTGYPPNCLESGYSIAIAEAKLG